MTMLKAHTWPGLDAPVYLPDTLPAEIKLIPSSVAGWTAGTKSTRHTSYTQHFTGNMTSSANGEWNWAAGGGRAALKPPSPGSYQLIVDGSKVIVAQRFDEAAGHAANATGNATSYASEMAIGGPGGYEAAFHNAAHVAAGVIVAKDWQVDTALLQHWNWLRADGTQKNCPSIIRSKGDWPRFVALVSANAANIRAHIAKEQKPPAPIYAKPAGIPELDAAIKAGGIPPFVTTGGGATWIHVADRVRAIRPTGRYQRANRDGARVGPDLRVGEEFDIDFITEFGGEWWGYTPWATRIALADVVRVSDVKEAA